MATQKQSKQLEIKLEEAYRSLGIDNGYISCAKTKWYGNSGLLVVARFHTYDDTDSTTMVDGEMKLSGKIETFVPNDEIEEWMNDTTAKVASFVREEFYLTMKELWSI